MGGTKETKKRKAEANEAATGWSANHALLILHLRDAPAKCHFGCIYYYEPCEGRVLRDSDF
jgi:hypothetical protein